MDRRSPVWARPTVPGLLLGLCALVLLLPDAGAPADHFLPIRERLIESGMARELVDRVFRSPPELQLNTVASALQIREAGLDYEQYLEPWALNKARAFLQAQTKLFDRVEPVFMVDRQTITAVLLVESRIGEYTGITPVLGILATLSLMDRREYQKTVWNMLPPEDRKAYDRAAVGRKLTSRASRARRDLRALLIWYEDRTPELSSLRGSIMGAVGWPQFLPDNVLRFGADGDDDGRIDLFDPDDAVFSVAKYLGSAGWSPESRRAREQAILQYNHSRPYMRTILKIAEKLWASR